MTDKTYLDDIYGIAQPDALRDTYDQWASSYDAEVTGHGYATPARCAAALAAADYPGDRAVLDFGCGTGLAGVALAAAGYTVVDGTDLSAEMLARAEERGVYRRLWKGEPGAPLDLPEPYGAIVAAGAIGPGAAPPELLAALVDTLPAGGIVVFSYSDHAVEDPAYRAALDALIDGGVVVPMASEYGPHLPGIGLKAWIHVLQKA